MSTSEIVISVTVVSIFISGIAAVVKRFRTKKVPKKEGFKVPHRPHTLQ